MGIGNAIDRAIGVFSPAREASRVKARAVTELRRRGYDGAKKGYRTDGWHSGGQSADAEIGSAAAILRHRMRDLVRNNPLAAQAVQVLINNGVGTGIRPRAKTGDEKLNLKINELFDTFSRGCDAHGRTDFYGLQSLAFREMIEGGDVFGIQHVLPSSSGREIPLQIELREADHLDDSKFRDATGAQSRINSGIEFDQSGRRSGIWLFDDHPGGTSSLMRRFESRRYPVDKVLHVFESQRIQNRGVPWGAPSLLPLRDLGDWQNAELLRKKLEACMVAVVSGDDDDPGLNPAGVEGEDVGQKGARVTDFNGNPVDQFAPGMFYYGSGATSVDFNTPAATGGVAEWNRVQMHLISAGFRIPYALMTGDMSQANFASSRVGLNEFRRMIQMVQWNLLIPQFCQPIWDWFIDMARLMGHIKADTVVKVDWTPPRFESVNPLQDVQADILEARAGLSSVPQLVSKRGYDPQLLVDEIAEWNATIDEKKLVLDTDPRNVTRVGVVQGNEPPTTSTDPDPTT